MAGTAQTNFTQFFTLILAAFAVSLISRRFRLPYAISLVVTGLIIGIPRLMPRVHLDPGILMTILLPPLLFESALNLHLNLLKKDWMPITLFTLLGTAASTVIVGVGFSLLLHAPIPQGMVFGALISTTDPISVIAVFRRLGAGKRLTLLMEAESLFNDAAAVVVFTVVTGLALEGSANWGMAALSFVQLAAGGVLLGALLGMAASRLHYELDDHLIEITLTTVVAYGSYLAADHLHVSGVMAVVASGVTLGSFGMQTGMTPGTRLAVAAFWEYAAFVVNSIVFLLIGIEAAYISWTHWVGFAVISAGLVLCGRAAIYPIAWLVNRLGGNIPVSWRHIMVWGGLRGALSMALALGLSSRYTLREPVIAAAFGVVLFSLLVQGSTVGRLLQRLGLARVAELPPTALKTIEAGLEAVRGGLEELDRLAAMEAHPEWALHQLRQEYLSRARTLEAELEQLDPEYASRASAGVTAVRIALLLGEKSAIAEARKHAEEEADAYHKIAEEIDQRLLHLRSGAEGSAHE
jgi:monovalent cation:H+ antiporter, CPA1 family